MKIKEIRAKSALSKSKIYDWTINPYTGCQFGCTYCYARFIKRFTGHSEDWGRFVDVKVNLPELLAGEIKRKKEGVVWMSGVCDPYQPLERKYQLTRKCLAILLENEWPAVIQSKSPLVLRDIRIFKEFKDIEVGVTITTFDEKIKELFEPGTPSIEERIRVLEALRREGIRNYAMIAPVLPGSEGLADRLKRIADRVIM